MPGRPIGHVEWYVKDLERAQRFYTELFGWSFKPHHDGYVIFQAGEYTNGGLEQSDEPKIAESPTVYVEVDDIAATIEQTGAAGGSVVKDRTPVPGGDDQGWFAVLGDPDGNRVGLYQAP